MIVNSIEETLDMSEPARRTSTLLVGRLIMSPHLVQLYATMMLN